MTYNTGTGRKLIRLLGKEAQMQVFGEYIYSIFDVADFFGVKIPAVQGWISSGELRAARVGRNYWIRGSAINSFVSARELGAKRAQAIAKARRKSLAPTD